MKRGNNIYHRADGRWEGRYYYKGTGKYKSVYGKNMTEAREKLDKLRNEAFTPSRNCHYLVSDIMQMWLENRRTHIKESSFASYQNKIHKHILPYFSQLKYSALTAEMLEKFITDKISQGLSAKYVGDMVIMMKSVAKWAETAHNFLNQVRNVELPKAVKKETETFSSSEQKALFQTLNSSSEPTVTGIKLAVYTGVRIGELCDLQWKDIDFEQGVLKVTKTVQRISHSTDATNALQQGFDVKTLSEILGHSGANVTMRVYLHTSMERKTACMSLVKEIA